MLADMWRHRDLLFLLVVREIRVRYARAALGIAWALFLPLVMMLIFSALNFGRLIGEDSPYRGIPYALYAYCGLLFWTHFSTSMTQGTPSLVVSAAILKKCAFPRGLIPAAKSLAAVFDLAIGSLFLAALMAWHGSPVGPSLALLPVVFLLQFLFTIGLVLLTSAANLFFRDVNYLVSVGIILAMFATCVVYPIAVENPVARRVLAANPMSAFLSSYREILLLGRWPGPQLAVGAVGAALTMALGAWAFRRLSPRFAEEV